jgi:hypothetical protein
MKRRRVKRGSAPRGKLGFPIMIALVVAYAYSTAKARARSAAEANAMDIETRAVRSGALFPH